MTEKNKYRYLAKIERDEANRYLVTFPDVPGCCTDGETWEEAYEEAHDALEEALAACIAEGEELPEPSNYVFVTAVVDK